LATTLGVEAKIEALPRQPGDVSHTNADIRRAQAEINYRPSVPIAQGIERFCAWFNERPHLWEAP
jgi:UDP-glucuronate 4-epimerase